MDPTGSGLIEAIAVGGPVAVVLAAAVWALWAKLGKLEAQNAELAKQWIDFLKDLAERGGIDGEM